MTQTCFYSLFKKMASFFTLRNTFTLLLLYSLVGIDKEIYFEEGSSPWYPMLFIKHGFSFDVLFELPVEPYYIMYNADLTEVQSDKLKRYCQIRYGVNLSECRVILHRKMIAHGFYKPE